MIERIGVYLKLAEFMDRIVIQIYCLSPVKVVICCIFSGMIFRTLHQRFGPGRWWRPVSILALFFWTVGVLWITVLRRSGGSGSTQWIPLHTYWTVLAGGNPELLRSAFMNAFLFFPAGLLCAGLARRGLRLSRGLVFVVPAFALFSLGIELTQYFFQSGVSEIDDVLHNTLGAAAGFASFWLDVGDTRSRIFQE